MRGRRVLMESLVSNGVRHIFGNPGTTETPLLDSLAAYPQIEYVMLYTKVLRSERRVFMRKPRAARLLLTSMSRLDWVMRLARCTARSRPIRLSS